MNTRLSHTIKIPPYETLIRVIPKAQLTLVQNETCIGARKELTIIKRKVHDAILYSQIMMIKDTTFITHQKGEKVWLNAQNLKTTHPTHKL